ncbi:unnamed protein product [Bursaphelenchus okinawaensis]|uniref:INTS8 TPR repeats domain-containing protein n=1 Tax=Bursaphelenchus okinawaensis TaxID=465554 RepID=A0A811JT18_9BILA|nr:unnamed protein product [Bursaphelenchus okinawaensis]CAG9082407.1 unnamed protein product [Bursaphelenchus okinawaensis]
MPKMLMLNFLKIEPEQNWYDYFVHRIKLKKLLAGPDIDRKTVVTLCDQFIEQAFATFSEIKQAKKRRYEMEDIQHCERKRQELWKCSWACLAALGWDLNYLLEHSNVVKVYNMISNLFEYVFDADIETDYISMLPSMQLNPKNIFLAFICARLIILVDSRSRILKPPVKQTVSNPNNQPDPALIEAGKIISFTRNVRKSVDMAVKFLEHITNVRMDVVNIPTAESFDVEKVFNENRVDFTYAVKHLKFDILKVRVECDLLLAHFKAVHMRSSREYRDQLINNKNVMTLNMLQEFGIDEAFRFEYRDLENICRVLDKGGKHVLGFKSYEVSKITKKTVQYGKSIENWKNHDVEKLCLGQVMSLPSTSHATRFATCGPPLWDMLHAYTYVELAAKAEKFLKIYGREFHSPKNILMSPIMSELLEKARFNYPVSIYFFMQLENVARNADLVTWVENMNTYTTIVNGQGHPLRDFLYNLCFEVLRLRMNYWDNLYGREWNGFYLKLIVNGLNSMVANSVSQSELPTLEWGLEKVSAVYYPYLLNMNLSNVIMVIPRLVRSPPFQFNFVRIVSTVVSNESMAGLAWKFVYTILLKNNVELPPEDKNKFWDVCCKLRHEKVIKHLLTYLLAFYNKVVVRTERLPFTTRLRNSWAFMDKTIRDNKRRNVPEEFVVNELLDCQFLLNVIRRLLENAVYSAPKDPYLRRQLGDVHYAVHEFDKAMLQYAEVFLLFQQKLTTRQRKDTINDGMITKITHCLYNKKMYVLACMSGQLRRDMTRHYIYLPQITQEINKTYDAGAYYFNCIYDTKLFEILTETFEKTGHLYYLSQLLKTGPTKSANKSNMRQVKIHEVRKRRERFIDVLIKTIRNTC